MQVRKYNIRYVIQWRGSVLIALSTLTGTAGISVSNQIYNRFKAAGKTLDTHDVAVVDGAHWHHYQVRISAYLKPMSSANRIK